jgi:glycosyltransferase involved in cell wall biosynthesis
MKILVAGSCQGMGGCQTYFRLLTKFLVKEHHEVFAVGIGDSDTFFPIIYGLFSAKRIPHTATNPVTKTNKIIQLSLLIGVIKKFKPEMYIAVAYGDAYAAMARALKKGAFSFYHEVMTDFSLKDTVRLRMIKSFDAIAVQSASIMDEFLATYKTSKPVAYLPVFSEPPIPEFIARLPDRSEPLRFAYFGRLASNKGIVLLVEAFSQISNKINAILDIHGEGPEKTAIMNMVRAHHLEFRIKLCGAYPSGENYARLLSSYNALILPSVGSEGIPLTLLEAMSYGLPFLATNVGSIGDLAVNNPDVLVINPGVSSMVKGLLSLSDLLQKGALNPLRLQAHYRACYSHEIYAAQWQQMLKNPREYFQP